MDTHIWVWDFFIYWYILYSLWHLYLYHNLKEVQYRQLRARRACSSKLFTLRTRKGTIAIDSCTAIAPFWFSTEHRWTAIVPFWLSTDHVSCWLQCFRYLCTQPVSLQLVPVVQLPDLDVPCPIALDSNNQVWTHTPNMKMLINITIKHLW